jgi:hypothetical protein
VREELPAVRAKWRRRQSELRVSDRG